MSTENSNRLSIKAMQELMYELVENITNGTITIDDMDTVNNILNYFGVTQDGNAFIYNGVIIPLIVIYSGTKFVIFYPVDEYEDNTMTVKIVHEDRAREMLRSNIFSDEATKLTIRRLMKHMHDALYFTETMLIAIEEISDANTHIFWLND